MATQMHLAALLRHLRLLRHGDQAALSLALVVLQLLPVPVPMPVLGLGLSMDLAAPVCLGL